MPTEPVRGLEVRGSSPARTNWETISFRQTAEAANRRTWPGEEGAMIGYIAMGRARHVDEAEPELLAAENGADTIRRQGKGSGVVARCRRRCGERRRRLLDQLFVRS